MIRIAAHLLASLALQSGAAPPKAQEPRDPWIAPSSVRAVPAALVAESSQSASLLPSRPWRRFDPWAEGTSIARRERAATIATESIERAAREAPPDRTLGRDVVVRELARIPTAQPDEQTLREAVSIDFRFDQRAGFAEEVGRTFWDRFSALEHRQIRAALEMSWVPPPHPEEPAREYIPMGAFETTYRDLLLRRRARSPLTGTATSAFTETHIVERLRDQLGDGRDPVIRGARTLLGEHSQTEGPLGFGKVGIRGYVNEWDNAGDLLGLTYEFGGFGSRVGGASSSASFKTRLDEYFVAAGATFDYGPGRANPRIQITRPLGEASTVQLFGGYGVDSFLLPGNVPYFDDPRDGRSIGLMILFDLRF